MAGSYFSSDTIAAVATSLAGDAGVGIIRLSGPDSIAACERVVRGLEKSKPRYLSRVEIVDPKTAAVVDDGLGVYFPEGQSFTGEEVVELQLHGGRFLLQSVLQLLLAEGKCRVALPGEFSFRAVRSGKLSLQGAEAVGQLIHAKSLFEVQAARRTLSVQRTERFDRIAAKIRELLAQSELSIDFIDQDVEVISAQGLKSELMKLLNELSDLLLELNAARRIARGLQVTLAGAPNAGKSTLFNALLAEDRAIVSPEAGTTRDVITEELALGPYLVRLADTAGLRETEGRIEREGIARAQGLIEASDATLLVVDACDDSAAALDEFSRMMATGRVALVALNKADRVSDPTSVLAKFVQASGKIPVISISASRGQGISELLEALRKVLDRQVGIGLNSFLPSEFQLQMVLQCKEALEQALELVERTELGHPELISASLGSAVRALSDLVGETTPDTVLEKIFSEFCIGK